MYSLIVIKKPARPDMASNGASRNQMRPGERSDGLGFVNRIPGRATPAGARGSARVSELGMGAGFGGSASSNVDALSSTSTNGRQGPPAPRGAPRPSRGGRGGGLGGSGGPGGPAGGPRQAPPRGYPPQGYAPQGYAPQGPQGYLDGPGPMMTPDAAAFYPPPPSSVSGSHGGQPPLPPSLKSPIAVTFQDEVEKKKRDADLAKVVSEIGTLKQRVEHIEQTTVAPSASSDDGGIAELRATVAALQQETRQFFGLVSGGVGEMVLLFGDLPGGASEGRPPAKAKASKGKWLKLSYPRQRVQYIGEDRVERTEYWYRVHIIDSASGELKLLWVSEKAADGGAAFERFATYPM